jgi:hypothetical protein
VTTPDDDRTGILIVHVWVEDDDADRGFRARITQTLDSTHPGRETTTAATPEAVYTAVRTWVETFIDPAA